jgi:hypothetical protein
LSLGKEAGGLSSDASNLFQMVLIGLAEAVHDHASAVLRLSEGDYVRSSKVLLRTLIESWIIARYVAADTTGSRAAAYIMKETKETKRFLEALLRLAAEKPGEQASILASAGLTSLDDLERRVSRQDRDLDDAKQRGVPSFPSVVECAKAVDLEVTYRSVYGYLLSGQVHARAGDTLRSLRSHNRDGGDDYKVLVTTLFLQIQMLNLTSEHFGRPSREFIARLEALINELQDSAQ